MYHYKNDRFKEVTEKLFPKLEVEEFVPNIDAETKSLFSEEIEYTIYVNSETDFMEISIDHTLMFFDLEKGNFKRKFLIMNYFSRRRILILCLFTILAVNWCQAQRNYHDDDPVKILKNWYQNEAPHHYPRGKFLSINSIAQLKNVEGTLADSVIFMTIRLGKEVADSVRLDSVALAKFKNLEYLAIVNTPYAPYDFSGLTQLKTLFFDYIYNLEAIPQTIGKLTQLESLIIKGANKITMLPEGIFSLTNLKTLKITGLRDTIGSISPKLGNLKKLEFLEIGGTVDIPETIGELQHLKEFRMGTKYGTNRPTKAIFTLPNLEFLSYYPYDSTHLEGIAQLQNLKFLVLNSDFVLPEIGELQNLEGLLITGYKSESYPDEFSQLQNLQALRMTAQRSLLQAPVFIPKLNKLRYLHLSGCNKMKTFDATFVKMPALEEMELYYNDLVREMPESLLPIQEKVKIHNAKRWGR